MIFVHFRQINHFLFSSPGKNCIQIFMRVLLIYPPCLEPRYTDQDHTCTPIGLYYLAALLLDRGFDVRIANAYQQQLDRTGLTKLIKEYQPRLVGFSIFNANRWAALEYCRIIKEVSPRVLTLFGGVAATFMFEHFLGNFPHPDYIIRGEGEIPFEIMARQLQKNRLEPQKIPGLAWREGGRIRTNPLPDFISDLNQLPDPARYFAFSHIALSRGCPGNCTFCASPAFWKRKVRFHSAEYFVNQLQRLNKRGIAFFNVSDDTFTLKTQLVREVCRKIIDSGLDITWSAISRVDRVDRKTLRLMRRAGCIQISFGVESGSESMRRELNKQTRTEDILNAFDLCRKNHILPRAYFIYACPGENEQTIAASAGLIREIKPLSAIFYILHLFPGTAMYEEAKKKRYLDDTVWLRNIEDVSWHELDEDMDENKVLSFGRALRAAFYASMPEAADSLRIRQDEKRPELAADFFSRLGLTLTHGDLARIEEIPDKEKTARKLFARALRAFPDRRAYLGLGLLVQKKHNFHAAEKILQKGLAYFPNDKELKTSLALCLMNTGRFGEALEHLMPFAGHPDIAFYIRECRARIK